MSRIGLKPITIPAGVDVNVNGATVTVKDLTVLFQWMHIQI